MHEKLEGGTDQKSATLCHLLSLPVTSCHTKSGKNGTINSVKEVSSGDKITIILSDGKINAMVE